MTVMVIEPWFVPIKRDLILAIAEMKPHCSQSLLNNAVPYVVVGLIQK
jgi:hypothetical protein